jgi:catechol 2,3-dioxygenase-like lactoylglutathione lyase family enzyme
VTTFVLDHVQLAMPANVEDRADEFYVGVLGFTAVAKPEPLARRGGRWYEQGPTRLHLGVDTTFVPSAKAHVAFVVDGYEDLAKRLGASHARVQYDDEIEGVQRFYTWDPFGNRLEIIRAESLRARGELLEPQRLARTTANGELRRTNEVTSRTGEGFFNQDGVAPFV